MHRTANRFVALCGGMALVAGAIVAAAVPAAAAGTTLRVGRGSCGTFATIGSAVSAASSGDTIWVCQGTYAEDVTIPANKVLNLLGHTSTIDATGQDNGVNVLSSGSVVNGFTVENAIGEGILVGSLPGAGHPISHVTISNNTVQDNDQGNPTSAPITTSTYAECNETPQAPPAPPNPGDCGEGIHLLSSNNAVLKGNKVLDNAGGVLVTDENGPSDNNLITHNVVAGNLYDCGVTLAGHNIAAAGGVYNNRVTNNSITNNGTLGQGGGVLFATPVPGDAATYGTGGAVYDNLVKNNYIAGNGLGGVTLHSHSTGEDLNGNRVIGNVIGTNNLNPDADFAFAGPDFIDHATTGVVIATLSDVSILVQNNIITDNVNGIWVAEVFGATVNVRRVGSNNFSSGTVKLVNVTH